MTRNNVNPIQKFVNEYYKHRSGITGFAKDINVGYQTIHKATMGLHSHIPPRLLDHMAKTSGVPKEEWEKDYADWVDKELRILLLDIRTGKIEAEAFFVPSSKLAETYPTFSDWRRSLSYSQIDFCKTFLLHQAIIQRYEAGLMKNLPESLKDRVRFILCGIFDMTEESVNSYLWALTNLPREEKKK